MKTRILVAVVGLPLLLLVVLVLPSVATTVLVAAMCVLAVYELLIGAGFCKHTRIFVYSGCMAILVCLWSWLGQPRILGMLGVLAFLCALFGEMLAAHTNLSFRTVCAAIFAGAVIPYLLGALIRLRVMENGKFFILAAFVLTMVPDSGAYFAGRAFGKHKLCPKISPKKTVEGVIGGFVFSAGAICLVGFLLGLIFGRSLSYPALLILSLVGTPLSIAGDLTFSVIKRENGIKDYGNLIPGHGGILDRFDGVAFTLPAMYFIVTYLPVLL